MSRKANTTLIGAFVLGAVALVIVVFVVFGSGEFFRGREYYVIFFTGDVNGLRKAAPVKLRGVNIGKVESIRGLMDDSGEVFIEVVIDVNRAGFDYVGPDEGWLPGAAPEEMIDFLISRGMKAQLATQSLVTGQLYVKLDYFPNAPAHLVGLNEPLAHLEIPAAPTSGEELRRTLDHTLNTFNQLKLAEISDAVLATMANVDSLIRSPRWNKTLEALTETLNETQRALAVFQEDLRPMSDNFVDVAEHARATLDQTKDLMRQLERTAATDRYDLQLALKEFTEASRALRHLMDYLEREPSSVVWGKD